MSRSFSVDPEVYDLAEHFTADYPHVTEQMKRDFATHIQSCVEDYLQNVEFDKEAAQQDAADRASGI